MLEHQKEIIGMATAINSKAAFSDKTDDLSHALSLLYIKSNTGGRNIFRDKFPDVAKYLFGSELITYDNEGTDDLGHRKELEVAASERRIALKMTIAEIVDKSVDKGTLQFDYVGQIIDEYGAAISEYLYASDVIERVRPGLLAKYKADMEDHESEKEQVISEKQSTDKKIIKESEEQKLSVEEKSILSNAEKDNHDYGDIKPIDTSVVREEVIVEEKIISEDIISQESTPPTIEDEVVLEENIEDVKTTHIKYSELFNNIAAVIN